jgi:DNA mismatch repair protein MutL
MGTIALLDPAVANQIAAGEVVERPASVVKELVENSLDAGATKVVIALHDGGRKRIVITDNGAGMAPDDAPLAFARHATSKLTTAAELDDLHTFGFRGEALASILAVSRVVLQTRRAIDDVGIRLEGAGGVELQARPVGCPVGTTLDISDLFWNVPARQKFLRTPSTELGQILRFVDALALARPDLHLTVWHNDKKISDYTPDTSFGQRAFAVFGKQTAAQLYPVHDDRDYEVRGLLSAPTLQHLGPSQLTLLVQGRPVSDRTLQHAIVAAYGPLLDRGRYPVGVLSLTCPVGQVDVNVHPQKTEVRFAAAAEVHAAVHRAIRPMLATMPWLQRSTLVSAVQVSQPSSSSAGVGSSWERGGSVSRAYASGGAWTGAGAETGAGTGARAGAGPPRQTSASYRRPGGWPWRVAAVRLGPSLLRCHLDLAAGRAGWRRGATAAGPTQTTADRGDGDVAGSGRGVDGVTHRTTPAAEL